MPPPPSYVDIDPFYDSLSPWGQWVWLDPYGWVWSPYEMAPGWRPYTYGYWTWTEAGWTWASYWQWGWAPFHYGRWIWHGPMGWVWIPGDVWGPAWVAWRYGPGYVGWAPLPPAAVWRPGHGVVFHGGGDVVIITSSWIFVHERDLYHPHVHVIVLPPARTTVIIRETRRVVHYEHGPHGVMHHGLPRAHAKKVTGRAAPHARLHDVDRPEVRREEEARRPDARVYRPKVKRLTEPRRDLPPPVRRPDVRTPRPGDPRRPAAPPGWQAPEHRPPGLYPRAADDDDDEKKKKKDSKKKKKKDGKKRPVKHKGKG
jgi:hypothetical protein